MPTCNAFFLGIVGPYDTQGTVHKCTDEEDHEGYHHCNCGWPFTINPFWFLVPRKHRLTGMLLVLVADAETGWKKAIIRWWQRNW